MHRSSSGSGAGRVAVFPAAARNRSCTLKIKLGLVLARVYEEARFRLSNIANFLVRICAGAANI
jgi:hypothetical protein